MTAQRFYQNQKAAAPEALLTSPFTTGDRVNTKLGTGTIYQSGPYESWVVIDETWTVTHVWTDFLARLPGQERIEDLQAGYPTLDQLDRVGYEVRRLDGRILTLGDALHRQTALEGHNPGNTYRIAKILADSINEFAVVAVTREEIPAYQPVGVGRGWKQGQGK